MKVQNETLTKIRGLCNWPPMWIRLDKLPSTTEKAFVGEAGILKEVRHYRDRSGRLYLTMIHDHKTYVACLNFENQACEKAFEHLQRCYGMTISQVGSSELP
jgi:hypothetical protein